MVVKITISREDPQPGQITNLQLGLYVVREVAEVESNGQVTILRKRNVLELTITKPTASGLFEPAINYNINKCVFPSYNLIESPTIGGMLSSTPSISSIAIIIGNQDNPKS